MSREPLTAFILAPTVEAAFVLADSGNPAAARSARHAMRHVSAAADALMSGDTREARSWQRLAGRNVTHALAAMAFCAPELAGAHEVEP